MARELAEIDAKVDEIDAKLAGIDNIRDDLTRIDIKIERIEEQVGRVNQKVDAVEEKAGWIGDLATPDKRPEFIALWHRQKSEATARETLRTQRQDQDLVELVEQNGLETSVDQEVLLRMATSKEELRSLLEKCVRDKEATDAVNEVREDARFLANMSYAYILIAEHYKLAREHVLAVAAEKIASDYFRMFAWGTFKLAVAVGLSVAGGWIVGLIGGCIPWAQGPTAPTAPTAPPEDATAAVQTQYQTDLAKYNSDVTTYNTKLAEYNSNFTGIGNASHHAHVAQAIGETVDGVLGIASDWALDGSPSDDGLFDPYDFFLSQEKKLRKAAAYLANLTDPGEREAQREKLREAIDGTTWSRLTQSSTEELDQAWGELSAFLSVMMRRLCWQLYCRSQWGNATYDYTLKVVEEKKAKALILPRLRGDASKWPRDVWTFENKIKPKHWDKIVNDFRGPEHDPNHPITLRAGGSAVADAREALDNWAYMSLAAVHCCQIKRYVGKPNWHWSIDLEKCPQGLSPYEALWGSLEQSRGEKTIKAYLEEMLVSEGIVVTVSEVRLGKLHTHGKATGKKGRIEAANQWSSALPWSNKYVPKITVLIERTAASTRAARVGVYKATLLDDQTPELHDGEHPCATKKQCWWCENAQSKVGPKGEPKLEKIDEGWNEAVVVKSKSVNYVNFPKDGKLNNYKVSKGRGLFCVKLDPREELQAHRSIRERQFHDPGEFWFRFVEAIEDTRLCPPPVLNPCAAGAQQVTGTLPEEGKKDWKIQVYADAELVGEKVLKKLYTSNEEWTVTFITHRLKAGQLVSARVATQGTEQDPHQRFSEDSAPIEVTPIGAPQINAPLSVGDVEIGGTGDGMPQGTKVRVELQPPSGGRLSKKKARIELGEAEVDEQGNWTLRLKESLKGGTVYAKGWWGTDPEAGWSDESDGVIVNL